MLKITQKKPAEKKVENKHETLLPLELTHIPGLIEAQTNYTESISMYPNRRAAFVGALAMLAFASGRRYRSESNIRTNEYFVCYAKSGSGKDMPRKVNKAIAMECGCASYVSDVVGSGEGLQDALLIKAKFLLQNDEFDTLLRAISEDKSGNKESLIRELLTEYGSAGSTITKRSLSASAKGRENVKDFCIYPHFVLYGSTVGQYLFETLNDRVLSNGLIARCLLADCGLRQNRQRATWRDVPEDIINSYKGILGAICETGKWKIQDAPDIKPDVRTIRYDHEAFVLNERLFDGFDAQYKKWDEGEHAAEQSFYARAGEHMTKLAMLYAISQNWRDPVISVDALNWAEKFVSHCITSMLDNIGDYTAINEHDADAKKILRKMKLKPYMSKRDITRTLKKPVADVEKVIEYMLTCGDINELNVGVYSLATKVSPVTI